MSFLYTAIFGQQESIEQSNPVVIEPKNDSIDLLEDCNNLIRPHGFELTRDSSMCYYLKSSSRNEIHFIYIKTIFYPTQTVHYEIGTRELYYPHLQTLTGLHERMSRYKVPISVIDNNTLQIGTKFFLRLKNTELNLVDC